MATCRQPGRALDLNRLAGDYPGHLHVVPLSLPEERSIADLAHAVDALDVRIDLLINNAGMLIDGERFGSVEQKSLRESFATNAEGAFLVTQALESRLAVDRAVVVNMSSGLGSIARTDGFHTPSYAISKAALNMASRLLARALIERGTIVVALSPGWVSTDMGGEGATLSPEQSVGGLLRVIDGLEPADSGGFFGHDGKTVPW